MTITNNNKLSSLEDHGDVTILLRKYLNETRHVCSLTSVLMRLSSLFIAIGLSLAVQASWFGGSNDSPPYSTWSTAELRLWLEEHSVALPKHTPTQAELRDLVAAHWYSYTAWTQDQYAAAQKTFADIRDSTFEKWDESTLRQFLLEQGVIAPPKSPKEELILLAKEKYKAYTDAASSFSARASTAVYGDSMYQMTKSASSLVSQATAAAAHATKDVARRFDESKDYVYSTWDEAQMRKYLESKGLLKTKAQKEHAELLEMMHGVYGRVTTPIWKAWSDSYIVGCVFLSAVVR